MEEFVAYSTKGTTRRLHRGRTSILAAIPPELEALFKICEQGNQLTNRMVEREVACLLPVFKHKTVRAKAVTVRRFTWSMGLTQRAVTHIA
jgi:hypothetical protein